MRAMLDVADRLCISVSWGKDSLVLLDLWRSYVLPESPTTRAVHFHFDPISPDDSTKVQDLYLDAYPEVRERYHRVEFDVPYREGTWQHAEAVARDLSQLPDIYTSPRAQIATGVRGQESAARRMRVARLGTGSGKQGKMIAPLANWRDEDVWGYIAHHGIPIPPVYAWTCRRAVQPLSARFSELGGSQGASHGRIGLERAFYQRDFSRISKRERELERTRDPEKEDPRT
jgi:3'-phosphoadenosine 5'-phosphosulfate sulfotransferase (PAPS reductase)/FAD synthetase